MSEDQLVPVLLLVAGVGLGLVFAVAAAGWFLWRLFGQRSSLMLSEAFENKLAAFLKVAPPPLPPLKPTEQNEPMFQQWQDQQKDQGLS